MIHAPRWLVLLLALVVAGCGSGRPQKKAVAKKGDGPMSPEALPPEVVESVLRSLVVGVEPTDYSGAMRQLNGFVASHAERKPTLDAKTADAFKGLGGDPASLAAESFTTEDLDYIVDVQALSPTAKALKQTDDAATARKVFAWVVRHLELATDAEAPAAGLYLTLLRGRAAPQDRVWVFLELLRQQGIEGAVVDGLGSAPGGMAAVFVRQGDSVDALLFDAESGSAVPNKAGDGPVTLRDVLKDLSLLQLSLGKKPAPAKPKLLVSLDASALAPRMTLISQALSADARLPLTADLLHWREAATAAAQGAGAEFGVWDWPARRRQAAGSHRDEAWDAVNPFWRKNHDSPVQTLLAGDADGAAKRLIKLDLEKSVDDFAMELRPLNLQTDARARWAARTRQDVIYFGGVAQLERAEPNPNVAHAWFERYLKQFAAAEFNPESILAASRVCLRVFTQGTQDAHGPGRALWDLADAEQRNTIELCARDEAKLASVTRDQAAALDQQIEMLLSAAEDVGANPQSDADRQAGKQDPRVAAAGSLLKDIGDQLGRSPSAFGENLLKTHAESLTRKVNESLQVRPGVKEGMDVVKTLSQRVGEARAGELSRAATAKHVLVELLLKLEQVPKLLESPNFANAQGALTAEELALLRSPGPSDARRQEAKRKLIAAAFGAEMITNPSSQAVWAPAVLRNLAACDLKLGRRDQAVAVLKTSHAAVQRVHRRELDAWARIIEKHPKWPLD